MGSILNVASVGGLSVESTIGAYNATKAALLHLTRTLARGARPRACASTRSRPAW